MLSSTRTSVAVSAPLPHSPLVPLLPFPFTIHHSHSHSPSFSPSPALSPDSPPSPLAASRPTRPTRKLTEFGRNWADSICANNERLTRLRTARAARSAHLSLHDLAAPLTDTTIDDFASLACADTFLIPSEFSSLTSLCLCKPIILTSSSNLSIPTQTCKSLRP
jgi:hypothetical protein